ncbi:AMP-binding protein [Rhodococcus sp. IEGM 1366]|uniref:AMP-binding protein n=1 Tax=Rhodococcus sp. IEGM 1366 TaxID=3082223 RepID=UPI002954AE00|nr:AMP-binding protein [Rhodococcus sp. IEGM 1366]MDV8070908.1 AMP-binding protein [Rhodococcus sp. IEGM 1366]
MKGQCAFGTSSAPAWIPTEKIISRNRLLEAMHHWGYENIEDLHRASIDNPEWFWRAVIEDLDITFAKPFSAVRDDSAGKPLPKWFVGGAINLAELCSHRHATGDLADRDAIVYEADNGTRQSLTFAELDREVRRFAANLRDLGVQRGDRIVLFTPVVTETAVAFLAAAMIGAVVVPAFSGYGAEAVASRIRSSDAVLLITADATTRRGKRVPLKETADEALTAASSIRKVIVVRNLADSAPMTVGRDVYWDELPADPEPVETVDTDPNDPVIIAYTSGTTGAPKGIVHSHGGLAVKCGVDAAYGFDVHRGDVVAWIADIGWMLYGVLLIGVLQQGATLVLTEGVPTYPEPSRLWDIVERNGVTLQGIAPTAARAVMAVTHGAAIEQDLSSLIAFASTGEAWDEPTWRWLFDHVGEGTRPIVNYSGGTEVPGGIVVCYPFLAADAASFNGPMLGMDAAVLDAAGTPVFDEIGELAVMNTWPGMTHSFWRDNGRYLETYWGTWPDVWIHGDLASVSREGSWTIHGRSDDTMKVSGRRIGPAELEAALLKDPRIVEVAVIGVPDEQRGQKIAAFVVVRDEDTDEAELVASAVHNVGRSFAPTIHVVSALPKTKNGKIMRRVIRARHLGEPTGDLAALDSPDSLAAIPALQK